MTVAPVRGRASSAVSPPRRPRRAGPSSRAGSSSGRRGRPATSRLPRQRAGRSASAASTTFVSRASGRRHGGAPRAHRWHPPRIGIRDAAHAGEEDSALEAFVVPVRRPCGVSHSSLIRSPLASAPKSRCSRNSSAARSAASPRLGVAGASQYSCRPQAGGSDSWNEDRRPLARGRSSSRRPATASRPATGRAARRGDRRPCPAGRRPPARCPPGRRSDERARRSPSCCGDVDRSVARPARSRGGGERRGSPARVPSSTRDTSRQCAPTHLLSGSPPRTRRPLLAGEQGRDRGPSRIAASSCGSCGRGARDG